MYLEKEFRLNKPIQEVWDFMIDPQSMARCIPGVESVETVDPDNFRAKVRVGVSFVSATFVLNVQIVERRPPTFLRSKIKGRDCGIGSTVSADTTLELEPLSSTETKVKYGANFVFTGQVASFGRSIMQAKTEEQTQLFVAAVRRHLGEPEADGEGTARVGVGQMARLLMSDVGTAVKERIHGSKPTQNEGDRNEKL